MRKFDDEHHGWLRPKVANDVCEKVFRATVFTITEECSPIRDAGTVRPRGSVRVEMSDSTSFNFSEQWKWLERGFEPAAATVRCM